MADKESEPNIEERVLIAKAKRTYLRTLQIPFGDYELPDIDNQSLRLEKGRTPGPVHFTFDISDPTGKNTYVDAFGLMDIDSDNPRLPVDEIDEDSDYWMLITSLDRLPDWEDHYQVIKFMETGLIKLRGYSVNRVETFAEERMTTVDYEYIGYFFNELDAFLDKIPPLSEPVD